MADFTGRIRRVRIKEQVGGTNLYKTVVVVLDDVNNQVVKTQVDIAKPVKAGIPAPLTNPVICPLKDENPEKDKKRYVAKGLKFQSDPMEYTYTVTATMLDLNGKVLGEPFVGDVTVEEADDADVDPNL